MESNPTLNIWHDYVCPFCYVEAGRIMHINEAEGLGLLIRFHPWPLEKADGHQPRAADEDKWVQLLRTVEPDAFSSWNPASGFWPSSSQLLFAAYEAALLQGVAGAARFDLMLRQAIFRRPRRVASVEALAGIAGEVNLNVPAFTAALKDGSAAVLARSAEAEGVRLNIRGIPTLDLPDGTVLRNPGLKIRVTKEAQTIQDQHEMLRDALRGAARGKLTQTADA
jgi:predicted DsbA family dithiol-disulfide isomerase